MLGGEPISADKLAVTEHFTLGLVLYRKRDFTGAIKEFERALERNPEDYPSKLYIQRSTAYLATPPAADWDGGFTLDSK